MSTSANPYSPHLYPPDHLERPLVYHGLTSVQCLTPSLVWSPYSIALGDTLHSVTLEDILSLVLVPPNQRQQGSNRRGAFQKVDALAGDDRYIFCRPLALGRFSQTWLGENNFRTRTVVGAWDIAAVSIAGLRPMDAIVSYSNIEREAERLQVSIPEAAQVDLKEILPGVAEVYTEYPPQTQDADDWLGAWLEAAFSALQGYPFPLQEVSAGIVRRTLRKAGSFMDMFRDMSQLHPYLFRWVFRPYSLHRTMPEIPLNPKNQMDQLALAWSSLRSRYYPYGVWVEQLAKEMTSGVHKWQEQDNKVELLVDQPLSIQDAAWLWLPDREAWVRPKELRRSNRGRPLSPLYLPVYRSRST